MAIKRNSFSKVMEGILSLPKGMAISFKYMFQRTATLQYPEERKEIPKRFRGILINDVPRCIVCELCAKVCPVNCIDIKKVRGADKKFKAEIFDIDLVTCLFCGLCTEACPTECLTMEGGYEGTVFDKKELIAQFVKPAGDGKFNVYSKDEHWITYDRAMEIMEKEEAEKKKNAPPKPAPAPKPVAKTEIVSATATTTPPAKAEQN